MGFVIPIALEAAGVSAATAGTIGTIAGIAGTAFSVLGAIQQGKASANSARYNAAVASNNAQLQDRNATLAAQEGEANAAIEQQRTRAGVGAIKASQAANGVDVNTGSAVDVRSSASELGELNAINIRSNAVRQAYGYQTQATSDRAQSQLDKQEASYDTQAGYTRAGTTLLGNAQSGSQSGLWDNFVKSKSLSGDDDTIYGGGE